MGELPDQSRNIEKVLQVGTRLAEFNAAQLHLSYRKDTAFQCVEIDSLGNQVSAERGRRQVRSESLVKFVNRFNLNQGQLRFY